MLVAPAAAATLVLGTVGPASAGGASGGTGDDNGDGYGAGATHVTVTGDVSQALRASVPSPPPLCWWEPVSALGWEVDPEDPEAVKKYWEDEVRPWLTGHAAEGALAVDYDRFVEAVKAQASGTDITWYALEINDDLRPEGDGYEQAAELNARGCGSGTQPGREGPILVTINWFPTGQQPDPVVDPEILAEYAYEVMDLVEPTLDWNPKIGDTANASLVNLPTWMWVDDLDAVGERSVTASAGPVSATVTASTDGLSVTSPAGTTRCDTTQARQAYAAGVDESSGCVLSFGRASWGYANGFPVSTSAIWQATWTSNQGEGGELENKTSGATTYIPVAESQALVSAVD